jgi:ssDNA-binding Zn-finger/Zn-ribbon topoisomerase 1
MSEISRSLEQIAKECGIDLPLIDSKYEYTLHTCYKCDKQMIVFDWSNSELWGKEVPPEPVPKTVQLRYTKTIDESYWANVCPFCDSVQGDWYLNMEPGGAFSGIPDYDSLHKLPEKHPEQEVEKEPEQKGLF